MKPATDITLRITLSPEAARALAMFCETSHNAYFNCVAKTEQGATALASAMHTIHVAARANELNRLTK